MMAGFVEKVLEFLFQKELGISAPANDSYSQERTYSMEQVFRLQMLAQLTEVFRIPIWGPQSSQSIRQEFQT
jgi:hypothetical protein